MILLFLAYFNRKALHLQPFHSTINRYSQFKAGVIVVYQLPYCGQPRGDNCPLMPIWLFFIVPYLVCVSRLEIEIPKKHSHTHHVELTMLCFDVIFRFQVIHSMEKTGQMVSQEMILVCHEEVSYFFLVICILFFYLLKHGNGQYYLHTSCSMLLTVRLTTNALSLGIIFVCNSFDN